MEVEAAGRQPEIAAPEDQTQRLDLDAIADLAEEQKKKTFAAELRKIANKSSTT